MNEFCPQCNDLVDMASHSCRYYPQPMKSCNRHDDCDAADVRAKVRFEENLKKPWGERISDEYIRPYADHCDDDCCEDCFGS
jgi:hypothetical protein